ncbi:MAG: HDOD domain-containing protein [Lachnospiraceae bacterium]|nr:HDOD domain-containing protein [Lachnospiraceae bacterium]
MLATLVPVFNDKMLVSAYIVYARKNEIFKNPLLLGTASLDGAGNVAEFDVVQSAGLGVLAGDREIYVPVNSLAIYSDLQRQCIAPPKTTVLLLDNDVKPTEQNIARLNELKQIGFKIAFREIPQTEYAAYQPVFKLSDILFLDAKSANMQATRLFIRKFFPNIKILVSNIDTEGAYEALKKDGPSDLYQGEFFRVPKENSDTALSPLKANYIRLLNVVNKPDFDLTDAAKVIEQDAALVVSLLSIVNKMTLNSNISSVRQAAALLGQIELKKWINTAVTKALCSDKPSEIMRISMLRARFAESLASQFYLGMETEELFLLGMFSLIDIMLDTTMEDALTKITVSSNIRKALLDHDGPLYPALDFVIKYEAGNWPAVSREIILKSLDEDRIYSAYLDSLKWYRDIIGG